MSNSTTRMTEQGRVILDELHNTTAHPTAWDIFQAVRERLPRISLGTVYRNLDKLCKQGLVRKLDLNEESTRYDAMVEKHYHLKCASCGGVYDIPIEIDHLLKSAIAKCDGFEVNDYSIDFFGICPNCRNSNKTGK